jgi:hypothetical protein
MNARQRLERAERQREKARNVVYTAAHPRTDVPLSGCLAMATEAQRAAYALACEAVAEAEAAAIRSGKAWRGSLGLLFWY